MDEMRDRRPGGGQSGANGSIDRWAAAPKFRTMRCDIMQLTNHQLCATKKTKTNKRNGGWPPMPIEIATPTRP